MIELTSQEIGFLRNLLLDRKQSSVSSPSSTEIITIDNILSILSTSVDFTTQQNGFLQYVLQEQAEINGSRHSVANEKAFMGPATTFIPTQTMIFIKSISDKLGAKLVVDTTTTSAPQTGRQEGSTWIMTTPNQKPVGIE